jgi:ABC-2 type transport system permease protein
MAGMNGDGVSRGRINGHEQALATGGGVLSPLARAQYSALACLRWHIFVNGLRSRHGAFEVGARAVTYALYGIMGLGLGFSAGAVAYALAYSQKWLFFPIVFWLVFLIWQIVPVMLASFQEQFDLGTLLRFPVGFRSFFLLYVVFGLSDVSTILGGLCCFGVWIGVTMARPDLCAWTALSLAVFAAFNLLLVRAIFAWIDRWLSQRRTREILALIFTVFFLVAQLMNPAVWQHSHFGTKSHMEQQEVEQFLDGPWIRTANHVQQWLPPGLAGVALRHAAGQQTAPALGSLAGLGFFVLAAGGALGLRLGAEYRGEELGAAPALKKTAASHGRAGTGRESAAERSNEVRLAEAGSTAALPIAAIIEKEVRTLFRTLPLLYAVGAPLVLVLVVSSSFIRGGPHPHTPLLAFPLCVFFAQLGFRQLFSNSLGAEGPGIQLYFLSPTPMRTVMLAKNLFHSVVFAVVLVLAGVLAALRLGAPDGVMVAATAAWLLFVLPSSLAVGNIFSLTMPFRVNPVRLSRQRPSQASTLLSLLLQAGMVGVGALVLELCSIAGMLWLAVPLFLALAGVAMIVWLRILGNSDDIAARRKDLLIATLMKTD